MQKLLSSIVMILILTAPGLSQETKTGKLTGSVIDKTTKEPLYGANIILIGTTLGSSLKTDGTFIIEKIPVGTYNVKVSMIGYEPQIKTDVVVTFTKPTQIEIALEVNSVQMNEEVLVEASYFYKPTETPTSLQAISYEEIRRAPGAAADISRMIQNMPGVVQTTDSRNDLIVRGGSPSENLNSIDGFEIPNINHFGSQGTSGGPIGMVQTEFISEATFLSGGFPASYGDKLSSVMDIKLREGSADNLSGSFELSAAGAGLIAEGPIGKQTTYLINARKSYLDLINDALGLAAVPNYTNINAKVTHRIDEKNQLNSIFLAGFDEYLQKPDLTAEDPEDRVSEEINSNGYQFVVGMNWKHIFDKNGFSNLHVWTTSNNYDDLGRDAMRNNKIMFDNTSNENQYNAKYSFSMFLNKQFELNAGTSAKLMTMDYNIFSPADTNAYGVPFSEFTVSLKKKTYKADGFGQLVYKPTEDLHLTIGGRLNYFEAINNNISFDPRIGASYQINPVLKLNASVGLFHQAPEMIWIYGNPAQNTDLDYLQAVHTVVGLDFYADSDLKITLEGYYKKYSSYPVSQTDKAISLANLGDDFGPASLDRLASNGSGRSYGYDFFLQKKLTNHVYGLVSYSYTNTRHQAEDGIERAGAFDIPHVFTVSGGYRLNENWEFSSKFRFVSGRPRTPINEDASRIQNRLVYDNTQINTERYPDYLRFDVRFDHRTFFENFTIVSFMEIQNVTNRKNPFRYFWNRATQKVDTEYQWLFFPVGGVKIEF